MSEHARDNRITSLMTDREVRRGAGIYSKPVLALYDLLVIRLSNTLAWRCPSTTMLAQYRKHLSTRHLDVGPGTGWYLAHTPPLTGTAITLLDLNTNSLTSAAGRLPAGLSTQQVRHNVLEPVTSIGPFDSISVNYLLHCIPGPWSNKGRALTHLASLLSDDGVLFGSTILGQGPRHNLAGRNLMRLYNHLGIFHNCHDDLAGLRHELQASFKHVQTQVVGTVAVFCAWGPRPAQPGSTDPA